MDQGKLFVFVAMPFAEEYTDVYEIAIKEACAECGVLCERVDEQYFTQTILAQIYAQIDKADLIIADMSGKNPNVFYEVGYAHGHDKKVILITNNIPDIPFDLKQHPFVKYDQHKIKALKMELIERIKFFGNAKSNAPKKTDFNGNKSEKMTVKSNAPEKVDFDFYECVAVSIDGKKIEENQKYTLKCMFYARSGDITFYIDFHNYTKHSISLQNFSFSLGWPKTWVHGMWPVSIDYPMHALVKIDRSDVLGLLSAGESISIPICIRLEKEFFNYMVKCHERYVEIIFRVTSKYGVHMDKKILVEFVKADW